MKWFQRLVCGIWGHAMVCEQKYGHMYCVYCGAVKPLPKHFLDRCEMGEPRSILDEEY